MNFKYRLYEPNGFQHIEIEPNEYITGFIHHIDGWLSSDVQSSSDYFLPRIKEILESNNPNEEEVLSGNAYDVLVRKDYTTITYIFEDSNPHMVPCTLPTPMLYEILKIWAKAKKEHDLKKLSNMVKDNS